jgi:asparagine synthase (glutamine-hydrolysing)
LEVRVPYLGEHVLEYAAKIPNVLRYTLWENKRLLRALARLRLPRKVAHKAKQGFGIPFDSWLGDRGREDLRNVLTSSAARLRDVIDARYIRSISDHFVNQSWNKGTVSRFGLYQRVYALWALERWLNRWNPSI